MKCPALTASSHTWKKQEGPWRREWRNTSNPRDPKNGIAVHVQKSQHAIDWEGAKVQATATGYWNRRTMEAIHIRKKGKSMNLDCGLNLLPMWNPLIDPTWTSLWSTHHVTLPQQPNTFTLIHFYTFSFMSPSLTYLKPASHCTLQVYNCRRPMQQKCLVLLNLCYVLHSKPIPVNLFLNSYKTSQPVLKLAIFSDPFQSGSGVIRIWNQINRL